MENATKAYMNVHEMANYLGIGRSHAYALTRSDSFPCFKAGSKKIIISKSLLDQWAENQIKDAHMKY